MKRTRWIWWSSAAVLVLITIGIIAAINALPGRTGAGTDSTSSPSPEGSVPPSATIEPSEQASTGDPPADPPTGLRPPRDPVAIEQQVEITSGLTAVIASIESVEGVAQDPGEVAGPAIRFAVVITNATSTPVPLGTTVVNVDYGAERTPAGELQRPGSMLFPSEVSPGATATGVYVFTVPLDQRGDVRITVDYSVDVAPLVFQGAVPA